MAEPRSGCASNCSTNANTPIRGASRLELRDGTLLPPREQDGNLTLDDKVTRRWVTIDRDGWVSFQPVNSSGLYRVSAGLQLCH